MKRLTKRYDTHVAVICKNCDKQKECRHGDAGISECHEVLRNRLAAYEDTGLEPEEILTGKNLAEIACAINLLKEYQSFGTVEHFRELAQAEKDGRLVVLPCKVGDTVYRVDYMTHSEALKSGVPQSEDQWQHRKYGRKRAKYLPPIVREKKMAKYLYPEIGKTVFLTREEAEAALKKREEADNAKD